MICLLLDTAYAVFVDCPNMIQFADNLGIQSMQPSIWEELHVDCCATTGISCDGNERVTWIIWTSRGLNGTINGTAIPSSVTHLFLERNSLTGPIPSNLPIGLFHLILHGNLMSGDLPSFQSSIKYLQLGYPGYPGNFFTGTLTLDQPFQLWINDNWIADLEIQDSSQINLSKCELSNNPLLGNPNIAGLTICTTDGLYSALMLPNTKSRTILATITTADVVWTTTKFSKFTTTTSEETTTQIKMTATTASATHAGSATAESSTTLTFAGNITIAVSSSVIYKGNANTTERGMTLISAADIATASTGGTITTKSSKTVTSAREIASEGSMIATSAEKAVKTPSSVIGILRSKTSTNDFRTANLRLSSTVGTVRFTPMVKAFTFNLSMVVRMIISSMLFTYVSSKTPFGREFKKRMKKGNTKKTNLMSALEF